MRSISRREALAASALPLAAAVVVAPAVAAQASDDMAILDLERRFYENWHAIEGKDDDTANALYERAMNAYESLLATPATSAVGIAAKLRVLGFIAAWDDGELDPPPFSDFQAVSDELLHLTGRVGA